MNESQQLREQMWDLVYGLLDTGEGQDLIARIKSDPQAARLYAEVRLQADLVGYAARVDDSSFVLNVDAGAEKAAPAKREKSAASAMKHIPTASRSKAGSRGGAWLAIAAATALAGVLAVGQFWPRADEHTLAAAYIVTEIEAPSSIPGGLANTVAFHTTTLDGEAQPATVDFALRRRGGRELLRQQVATDNLGRASVEIPGSALEPGVRLEVFDVEALAAVSDNIADRRGERISQTVQLAEAKSKTSAVVAADLPVQAEPQMAYVLLEEPPAANDKAVNVSVWGFGAFSGKPAPTETAEQVAQSIPGLALADESGAPANELGVFKGVVQNHAFDGRAQGLAFQNSARAALGTMPAEPAAAPQQPYFRAGQGQGGGIAEGTASAPNLRLQRGAEAVSQQERQQQAKEQRTALAQVADSYGRNRQSKADENIEGAGAVTSVAPGEPINVEIPAEYANKQLVIAANTRGVTVANTNTDRENKKFGAAARNKFGQLTNNNIQLALPPEADGQIEVAVLDPATSPPQLVSRNYVYREPARKLQIDVGKLKERFAPGEKVQVTFQVSDEAGRPAADTRLGVRLWNEQLVQQNAEQPLLLAEAIQAGLSGATISQSATTQSAASQAVTNSSPPVEALAKANATAGDTLPELLEERRAAKDAELKAIAPPAGGAAPRPLDDQEKLKRARAEGLRTEAQAAPIAPAAPAASPAPPLQPSGQLLGEALSVDVSSPPETEWFSNWGSVASQEPVELASNRDVVQAAYDVAASSAREQRQRTLRAIGGAAIAGSAALLALLAVLAARRMAGNVRVIAPALAISLASLLVGIVWVGWLPRGGWQRQQIAMTSGAAPAATEPAVDSAALDLSSSALDRTADFADAPVPPTIRLTDPTDAPPAAGPASSTTLQRELAAGKPAEQPPAPTTPLAAGGAAASGALGVEQRQAGQGAFGGGAGVAAPGATPSSGVARERLEIEQLERKLAANAPMRAAKEVAGKDGDKAAAGIAGAAVQPAPTPTTAAAAPASPAPAGQPAAGRSFGAAIADGKSEAGVASRGGARFTVPNNDQAALAQAPASLYFNPNLQTNAQGLATIEFTMPPVDSQYRLLIDALGQGRIGSRQQLITCQSEPAKEAAK